jgi:hypothetical protein
MQLNMPRPDSSTPALHLAADALQAMNLIEQHAED